MDRKGDMNAQDIHTVRSLIHGRLLHCLLTVSPLFGQTLVG